MLVYAFALIILLHGLIHLMGFAKAFGYGNIPSLSTFMSKPVGLFWLLTAILLIITAIFFLFKKEYWWMMAIPAVICSQVLILMYWKDARAGTTANLLVLVPLLISAANYRVQQQYRKEVQHLLSSPMSTTNSIVTHDIISQLPVVVQKWLIRSGAVGKEKTQRVYLQQTGEMMTKPGGKWIAFTAEQYFTTDHPSFNWRTTIQPSAFVQLTGRDKFENGKGHMLIKAYSLFPVADAKGKETDQGTMLRYLAETCWFPSAALNEYIKWEAVDSVSAKATMRYGGIIVSGVFTFNKEGDMLSFEADRYYDDNKHTSLEKWLISCKTYTEFNGIRIPSQCEVTWKLKTGDCTWLKVIITNIVFNHDVPVKK